ncbi:hypothetical protein Ahy_A01g003786 [Arachis hypogaea]|uniref:Uncharacterized protein n=1 Tax=Arachis hypogaea TaxID=3818 RepID=A0A445ETW2_ARAHY|nr:hypothetical protein Ahy_A01g003786 [Arachis hypogaea]
MLRIMRALTSKDASLSASWLIWILLVGRSLRKGGTLSRDWIETRQLTFLEGILKHLPNYCTDHTPICLQPYATSIHNRNQRTSQFVAAWLSHPNFNNLVMNFWDVSSRWTSGTVSFKNSLRWRLF